MVCELNKIKQKDLWCVAWLNNFTCITQHVPLLACLHHSSICFPFCSCSLFKYSLVAVFSDQIRKFWQLLIKSSKMLWGLFGSALLSSLWNDIIFLVVSTWKHIWNISASRKKVQQPYYIWINQIFMHNLCFHATHLTWKLTFPILRESDFNSPTWLMQINNMLVDWQILE